MPFAVAPPDLALSGLSPLLLPLLSPALPFGFVGADEEDFSSSASRPSCGVRGAGLNAAMLSLSVCATVSLVISFASSRVAFFSLSLGISMMESERWWGGLGVGVSGLAAVTGDPTFEPVGVVSSPPLVQRSCLKICGDGEPVVSEALAIRSSEEGRVWEKSAGEGRAEKLEMPRPWSLAAAVRACWVWL